MAEKRDYYEVLGVDKSADDQTLKRAYRKLAKQYHPDANPGDKEAEEKFKEASEAYAVLSDKEKRAKYDQFGHAAFEGGGTGYENVDFSSMFQDLFSSFGFGGGGSSYSSFGGFSDIFENASRSRRSYGPSKGASLQMRLTVDFREAAFGCTKNVEVYVYEDCPSCSGSGAKAGTSPETCPTCKGSGYQRIQTQSIFGTMVNERPCGTCGGSGKYIKEKCSGCGGSGKVRVKKTYEVKIPAGIDNGDPIRLQGKGEPGVNGGPSGDLYIYIYYKPDAQFTRDGNDLYTAMTITFPQAALGDEVTIRTLDGEVSYQIPAGTQTGTRFRLKEKGVPYLNGNGQRGNLYVTVEIETPKKLSEDQKEKLKAYAKSMGDNPSGNGKKPSFFQKMKESFE